MLLGECVRNDREIENGSAAMTALSTPERAGETGVQSRQRGRRQDSGVDSEDTGEAWPLVRQLRVCACACAVATSGRCGSVSSHFIASHRTALL